MPRIAAVLIGVAALAFPAAAAANKTVTLSDTGSSVRIKVGAKLIVKLPECVQPCANQWRTTIAWNKTIIKRTGNTYIDPEPTDPPSSYAMGTRVFTYTAKKAGKTHFQLHDGSDPKDNSGYFYLTVKVVAPAT